VAQNELSIRNGAAKGLGDFTSDWSNYARALRATDTISMANNTTARTNKLKDDADLPVIREDQGKICVHRLTLLLLI
jgi:hypothetical protein